MIVCFSLLHTFCGSMASANENASLLQTLAQNLKDCCEVTTIDGSQRFKETNPQESALILHKIAKIYLEEEPNKISLIKSVGLLNAAAVRNPSNITAIEEDISNTCRRILQLAGASDTPTDLIRYAQVIKNEICELRNDVDRRLNNVTQISGNLDQITLDILEKEKITQIQEIQEYVTDCYKQIMRQLSEKCQIIMGNPPCKYAIAGLGSLARKEITPYSDFEHVILLEKNEKNEETLEYFRWFSVIFHTVILNLRETIIPSLNIDCLNNDDSSCWFFDAFTQRGIALDGMTSRASVFPLGWQHTITEPWMVELIRPVDEMLSYLQIETARENEHHLNDVLTSPCFVYGNDMLFNEYLEGIYSYWDTRNRIAIKNLRRLLQSDLERFSFQFAIRELENNTFNLKKVLYRSSTIFVSTVGKVHKIHEVSSFKIIDSLFESRYITENAVHKLKYAVAVACEVRLKVYNREDGAQDLLVLSDNDINSLSRNPIILSVGKWSILNYFQIAYCLQYEIRKLLRLREEFQGQNSLQLLNLKFHRMTGFDEEADRLQHRLNTPESVEQDEMEFDKRLHLMQNPKI